MILTYNDKEVECFHPICEKSLKKALKLLKIDTIYSVHHHKFIGQLEMDFVITNNTNDKVLCVIEVKRTPAAVKSSRYQYQAMSYIQQTPPALIERPYYILTNIEYSCIFRYDAQRPNVHQQLLNPGLLHNVDFVNIQSEKQLIDETSIHYASLLKIIINNSGKYCESIENIISLIISVKDQQLVWNSLFACISYEYIRGSFETVNRKGILKDIRQYDQRLFALQKVFEKIDFKGIFRLKNYADIPKLDNNILNNIYSFGKNNIDADELVTTIHQIISTGYENQGEVPTDIELARLMTIVAKHYQPNIKGFVCDPAAGSGNLLSCISETYTEIEPRQIKANDKNPLLSQLLSMRIGLKYPKTINPNNAPEISVEDIIKLSKTYFEDVDLMLVNPPMIASIHCFSQRNAIYERIKELGGTAITNIGQVPLEAAFIELLNLLAKDNCVTVALLPKTHLTSLGDAMITLRKFLLEDFGLRLIFNYPGQGLFENVTKDTIMVVGQKGYKNSQITIVNSLEAVANIDLSTVSQILNEEKDFSTNYLECIHKSYAEMYNTLSEGWIANDSITIETVNFLNEHFELNDKICKLSILSKDINRGQVGNKGLSNLLYISSSRELFDSLTKAEKTKLCAGMRNAKLETIEVEQGDSYFFNQTNFTPLHRNNIVEKYRNLTKKRNIAKNCKQRREEKSEQDILDILESESSHSCAINSVLLPRDLRRYGRVYRCSQPTFVSTNFFIIQNLNEIDSKLLASWMTTIFYQLSCERYGKNQEGTRKMERGELFKTHIPVLSRLTLEEKNKILTQGTFEGFLDLQQPEIRNVDIIWANIIFGGQSQKVLDESLDLLLRKATNRNK